MTTDAQGRSVAVTGAGSGIGRSIARRLAADGWRVAAGEIDSEIAATLHTDLRPGRSVLVGDAGDRAVLKKARVAAEVLAPLQGWVNNVGIALIGNLHEPHEDDADRVIRVNFMSYFWGASEAIRTWVAGRTTDANIGSAHGRASFNIWAAHDVAKAGVDALTRYVAVEYGSVGIRCNAIASGAIRTPLVERVIRDSPDSAIAEREMSMQHPLERIGESHEVAAATAWLLSEESSFVTGESLAVDGGPTARCYRHAPDAGLLARYAAAADGS